MWENGPSDKMLTSKTAGKQENDVIYEFRYDINTMVLTFIQCVDVLDFSEITLLSVLLSFSPTLLLP